MKNDLDERGKMLDVLQETGYFLVLIILYLQA